MYIDVQLEKHFIKSIDAEILIEDQHEHTFVFGKNTLQYVPVESIENIPVKLLNYIKSITITGKLAIESKKNKINLVTKCRQTQAILCRESANSRVFSYTITGKDPKKVIALQRKIELMRCRFIEINSYAKGKSGYAVASFNFGSMGDSQIKI